jgi:hypothetical protein
MLRYLLIAPCALVAFWPSLESACAIAQQAGPVGSSAHTASKISSQTFCAEPPPRSQAGRGNKSPAFLIAVADGPYPSTDPSSIAATQPIFAPNSFWYTQIPKDAPVHPNSANFVADFLRQIKAFYGNVGINTVDYTSPIYVVGADVATTLVEPWDCQEKGYRDKELAKQWLTVPIPHYAQPADGTDAEMTIYQPSTDTMWEFWGARKVDGRWEACWGGRMLSVSKNDGIWPPYYGTTATGLPFLGGQIAVDELRRGVIPHAIGIALVEVERAEIYSWPANRSDGYNSLNVPNRIPEGLRFRLDPGIDVDSLKIHPIAKIIAKAGQTYGFVVWDKAGAIGLRAENAKRFTVLGMPDPYPALWNGTPSYRLLEGIPWERLQFLPMNYGKP